MTTDELNRIARVDACDTSRELPTINTRYFYMLQRIAKFRGRSPRRILQEQIQQAYNRVVAQGDRIPQHKPEWEPTANSNYVYCVVCLHTALANKASQTVKH